MTTPFDRTAGSREAIEAIHAAMCVVPEGLDTRDFAQGVVDGALIALDAKELKASQPGAAIGDLFDRRDEEFDTTMTRETAFGMFVGVLTVSMMDQAHTDKGDSDV